jgi:nitrate/nitrite transporter NarK
MGLVLGPLCDQYGARILITLLLLGGAIPCLCTGLVTNLLYMGKCAECVVVIICWICTKVYSYVLDNYGFDS